MKPSDFIHPEGAGALRQMGSIPGFAALVKKVLAIGFNQGVVKMAGSCHTPACCMSKLRSSIKAGKKQPRVWLEYICSVAKMLLSPSFSVSLVLLWSPYDSLKMVRSEFEDGSKWYAMGNACSSAKEAGFIASRTHVPGQMNLCFCFEAIM